MRANLALATCVSALVAASGAWGQLTPTAPPPLTPAAPPAAPSAPTPAPSAAPLTPAAPPVAPNPPPPPPPPAPPPAPIPAPPSTGGSGVVTKLITFAVGNWSVSAFSAPGSVNFDNCAATVPYDNGVTLGFRITRDFDWSMALFNPAWSLTQGSSYSLTYAIDYSPPAAATAIALGPHGVRVVLPPSADLFRRFMAGARLNVVSASQTFGFNLTDTSVVLPDLLTCVQNYVGPTPTANPFAR
jgi:hypothetical protein